MFSGLIKTTGTFLTLKNGTFVIKTSLKGVRPGDSISVNGVCLTVKKITKGTSQKLFFDLSEETLEKTTLGQIELGVQLNLEPALTLADALGGHIVQGHVDGVGQVNRVLTKDGMKTIYFKSPKSIMRFIVPKGSVTVDGVSLTVVKVSATELSVALIPYTLQHTNLDQLKPGSRVNLEADIIGKYVSKYLEKK